MDWQLTPARAETTEKSKRACCVRSSGYGAIKSSRMMVDTGSSNATDLVVLVVIYHTFCCIYFIIY